MWACDDEGRLGALSVVKAADAFAYEQPESEMDEVDALLSDWQELQAIADSSDDGVPAIQQQAKMLESWRQARRPPVQ